MFINFWYPAAMAEELKQQPIKVKMLGQNMALFRDGEGRPHCVSNICVHRNASLANGWVQEGKLVCPYHGWQYNGEGKCTYIPSLGPDGQANMPRAQVDAYPVVERYGLLFVFLGDLPENERPPIMPVDEWQQPGWRTTLSEFNQKAYYRRVVENALDFSHPEFVHFVGRKGADPNYSMPDYEIVSHEWGAGSSISFKRQAKGLMKYFRDSGGESEAGTTFWGPHQFVTRIKIDEKMKAYQYAYALPVDEYTLRVFLVSCRSFFLHPWLDRLADYRNGLIAAEDREITEAIEPIIGREGASADLSVKCDAIQLSYRKMLAQWEQNGWRIDTEKMASMYRGKDALMIPGPGRRESKTWVFDTVPMK
ncbi:aromatic ring-hydroxylating oxygenase subunit alpha [Oceanicoccus sagamiensis]|uniref:Rieske domain-containing protein n=1 Tax=Oceanicoccus sagamiensis TaxID=716816 RepID=A0A1X9N6C4_9GAMM|nr:aromatic ring-hydroxylating dioxygenase subunit alpha [Oceanicoccus sagamiensis]ARN73266.1 hypothetical protein BST96_03575 [Oceanicoccus sagamiensis]